MHDKFTNELAATVYDLFKSGKTDPSAEEIAAAHFPNKTLPNDITEVVRKRLIKVRNVIQDVYEIPVCLVTEKYYVLYRDAPPVHMKDAHACLPGGYNKGAWGVRRQNGDSDLIWQAMMEKNLISAAGKEKKSTDRVLRAVELEDLSDENALRLLQQLREHAAPEKPEIAMRLFAAIEEQKQLEAGEEDEEPDEEEKEEEKEEE